MPTTVSREPHRSRQFWIDHVVDGVAQSAELKRPKSRTIMDDFDVGKSKKGEVRTSMKVKMSGDKYKITTNAYFATRKSDLLAEEPEPPRNKNDFIIKTGGAGKETYRRWSNLPGKRRNNFPTFEVSARTKYIVMEGIVDQKGRDTKIRWGRLKKSR